jgi:hypothetical protein
VVEMGQVLGPASSVTTVPVIRDFGVGRRKNRNECYGLSAGGHSPAFLPRLYV